MCLIAIAWKAHPAFHLVVAAHRDEWRDRPSAPAHWWADAPHLAGGRDLQAGGTWLGVTRSGRFAAVTNYRDPRDRRAAGRSRGELATRFLQGTGEPVDYLEALAAHASEYPGFNLLAADSRTLAYFSNRDHRVHVLEPGVHALSNHLLNTPWPKLVRAKRALADHLLGEDDALFGALADATPAPDHALPDTGVGIERERELSPMLITGVRYGTRSTAIVRLGASGGRLVERTLDATGGVASTVTLAWPEP